MKTQSWLAVPAVLVGLLFAAGPVWADSKGVACGPGATVMAGKKGLDAHLVALLLDWVISAVVGNPVTLAMTSGTSGCNTNATVNRQEAQEKFVADNMDRLSVEMAQGQGSHVDAMALLMGCSSQARDAFSRLGQGRYEVIFSATAVDAKSWLEGLRKEISADAVLASQCSIS